MRAVFISYRREDSEGHAGRLFEDLVEKFGRGAVFMDVARIEPGRDFRRAIEEQVGSCAVLLVIIGKSWLDAKDEKGQRRLDDPADFVRLETVAALKRDIPVIPVLVQGASMPRPDTLPGDLRELAFRNCVELTHARWESDVQLLINALRSHVESEGTGATGPGPAATGAAADEKGPAPASRHKLWRVAAPSLVAAVVVVTALYLYVQRSSQDAQQRAHAASLRREAALAEARATQVAADRAEAAQRERDQAEAVQRERDQAEAARRERDQAEAARRERDQAAVRATAAAEKDRVAQAAADRAAAERRARQAGRCIQGYVWREATPEDHVCVEPEVRARTAEDNQMAPSRRNPGGGPYGPDTCRQGYVWREAVPGDHVCVTPDIRDQAAADNRQAAERVVRSIRRGPGER